MSEYRRRILVVDDDLENIKLLTEALQVEEFDVQSASSGRDALDKIEKVKPELVLLDYNMPGISGLETLKMLRSKANYVAVIFVSANSDQELIVDCLGAGADDYVRKPFRFSELISRIRVRLRIKDMADELRVANQKLRELSEHDDLTDLFNMRTMYDRIDLELKRARRFDRKIACVMMDIDNFKEVNDHADHLFGSFVIKQIGELIQRNVRDVDLGARYGGDEFLIVLTETSPEGVKVFTERLRKAIESHTFNDGKTQMKRTCSFGYSLSSAEPALNARELVRRADHALYAAKAQGRNRVQASEE